MRNLSVLQTLKRARSASGCRVLPGDWILGDIDGVVVIPGAMAESVITEVEAVMQTENQVRKAILEGMDPQQAYLRHRKF